MLGTAVEIRKNLWTTFTDGILLMNTPVLNDQPFAHDRDKQRERERQKERETERQRESVDSVPWEQLDGDDADI